jgi:hypothetical protein
MELITADAWRPRILYGARMRPTPGDRVEPEVPRPYDRHLTSSAFTPLPTLVQQGLDENCAGLAQIARLGPTR